MTVRGQMSRAVTEALKNAQIPPSDAVGVALVRRYAALLDEAKGTDTEPKVIADLGPKLLAALNALGLTLAGRNTKTKEEGNDEPRAGTDALAEYRARRDSRSDRAKVVHPTPS